MKVTHRIPTTQFGYIEVEQDVEKENFTEVLDLHFDLAKSAQYRAHPGQYEKNIKNRDIELPQ